MTMCTCRLERPRGGRGYYYLCLGRLSEGSRCALGSSQGKEGNTGLGTPVPGPCRGACLCKGDGYMTGASNLYGEIRRPYHPVPTPTIRFQTHSATVTWLPGALLVGWEGAQEQKQIPSLWGRGSGPGLGSGCPRMNPSSSC